MGGHKSSCSDTFSLPCPQRHRGKDVIFLRALALLTALRRRKTARSSLQYPARAPVDMGERRRSSGRFSAWSWQLARCSSPSGLQALSITLLVTPCPALILTTPAPATHLHPPQPPGRTRQHRPVCPRPLVTGADWWAASIRRPFTGGTAWHTQHDSIWEGASAFRELLAPACSPLHPLGGHQLSSPSRHEQWSSRGDLAAKSLKRIMMALRSYHVDLGPDDSGLPQARVEMVSRSAHWKHGTISSGTHRPSPSRSSARRCSTFGTTRHHTAARLAIWRSLRLSRSSSLASCARARSPTRCSTAA